MIAKVKALREQNILDIAIQEYGSVEGLINVAKLNDLDVDADELGGLTLKIDTDHIIVPGTRTYFKNRSYTVTTGGQSMDVDLDGDTDIFDDTFDDTFE
jgi:hypothetical protein